MNYRTTIGVVTLGVIQGLTEFLPVSSSGHLVVGQQLFKLATPSMLLDIVLHFGTLIPVVWLYRADIAALFGALGRLGRITRIWQQDDVLQLLIGIGVGTIPTAIIGFAFRNLFERLFSSPSAVGIAFLATGAILFVTRFKRKASSAHETNKAAASSIGLIKAFVIGIAQGVAITPGISRSGTTIATALLLGVEREHAARFSFLLALPAILGAVVLEVGGNMARLHSVTDLTFGAIAAAISGYLALRFVVYAVKKGDFHWFALYLWPLGICVLWLAAR